MGKGKIAPASQPLDSIGTMEGGKQPTAAGEEPVMQYAEGNCLERAFEKLGRTVATHSAAVIAMTFVVMIALSSGFGMLEAENRPEKQWVAKGSISLDQNEYVKDTWPANQRWNFYAAECKTEGCNILEAKYVQRLAEIDEKIKAIVIDGDTIVAEMDSDFLEKQKEQQWKKYAGHWSFDASLTTANSSKCFMWGPNCAQTGMLSMFPADVPSTNAAVLAGINSANVTLSKTLGGIKYSSNGDVISASAIFGTYQITLDEAFIESTGSRTDPLADEWEAAALCVLGVDPDGRNNDQRYTAQGVSQGESCPEDDLLRFAPQFGRSWSDEFGAAIKNDISKMGIAYMLMLGYLIVMLSRWDPVHSMIGMSFVVIIIVGFSFAGCMGIGAFIGLYNNNLNNNIPFLLLGLGVDDAFVLVSEFQRASKMNPSASVEERIGLAMKSGGMSVLITSATDALAFMVGSATVLPALSWFCMFAGIGVVLCFLLQIFLFMPCLAINARRAEASRLDCCCCFKYQETAEDQPRGCCACCGCGAKAPTVQPYRYCLPCCLDPKKLSNFFGGTFGEFITSNLGVGITLAVFGGLFAVGCAGLGMIYKDFKLEWFIPDDSYVQDFVALNDEYFKSGKGFAIYTPQVDYFASRSKMVALTAYLDSGCPFLDRSSGNTMDWHKSFSAYDSTTFTDGATFYTAVHAWLVSNAGSSFRTSVKFTSAACNDYIPGSSGCVPASGISATRLSATIAQQHVERGTDRYDAMVTMRADVEAIMSGAFPFNFEFLYWEEVGVIDRELTRNLLICGGVILVMVSMLIPVPRISLAVCACIFLAIIDVVGLLYFWDVTISGVSTIYILICVGLAVDYAAHTAHMFKEAVGDSKQRAREALGRIGPSVFNAIISTLLAVVVIGFSKSYVFVVFFKAFFLVTTVAGAHGIWLLPCVLGLVGGSNGEAKDAAVSEP